MPDERDSTVASSGQGRLIAAAMRQVAPLPRTHPMASSGAWPSIAAGGASIAGYELLEEIHRGGQGVVYKALQRSTQRHVAIKILRDGELSTPAEIARFEQEVRILGRLRHANIVRIFDSGVVGGRFHYVMDYIAGQPFDQYVQGALPNLSAMGKLTALFVKVCDAVNAAHVRGIIHRDLKPGNIRVDADGEPFVLDFGLSKLTAADTSDVTMAGQFVGSLPWASPEQAQGRSDAIDLRTDVYSLGVLFYRTLTGVFPYDVDGGLTDVLERIIHAEARPPRAILPRLDADLETILLKCLQKDPERRYQSAGELGRDLERFARGEPIEARRDSMTYVLGKQLARYRIAAITAAAFAAVLVAALMVSIKFWRDAEAARADAVDKGRIALQKEKEALSSAAHAEEQRKLADRRARETQDVAEFHSGMISSVAIDALGRSLRDRYREQIKAGLERETIGKGLEQRKRTPDEIESALAAFDRVSPAANTTDVARQIVDEHILRPSMDSANERFADKPLVRAQIQEAVADTYRALAIYDVAEKCFRAALNTIGEEAGQEAAIAAILNKLAMTLRDRGDLRDAEPVFRESVARYRALPEEHHAALAAALCNYASMLQKLGDFEGAEARYREALDWHHRHPTADGPDRATTIFGLATLLRQRGDRDGAEPLYREALAEYRRSLGPAHPFIVTTLAEIGMLLTEKGDLAPAEQHLREALEMGRAVLGERHPSVAMTLEHLATLRQAQGEYAEAEHLLQQVLAINREILGDDNMTVATNLNNLGSLLRKKGDLAAAEAPLREALDMFRRLLGSEHQNVGAAIHNLASVLMAKRDFDAAEPLQREAIEIFRRQVGDKSEAVATCKHNLALLLISKGDFDTAEPLEREVFALRRELLGQRHPLVAQSQSTLARILHLKNELINAEQTFEEALAIYAQALGPDHPDTASCQFSLARLLHRKGDAIGAERLIRPALETLQKKLPAHHVTNIQCRVTLANILIALSIDTTVEQKDRVTRLTEAESLLSDAWSMINRPFPGLQGERENTLRSLVLLHETWHGIEPYEGHDAQVGAWRALLSEWSTSTRPASR